MRVRWAPTAVADLEEIDAYLRENHPTLAATTVRRLYQATRSLKQFPHLGRTGRARGTREFVMAPLPYIIVYGVEQEVIHILRVMHTSRRWPPAS